MQESVGKKPQRMVRKQILITPKQNRRLKARAAKTGMAEADIVRHGLDLALSAEQANEDDWRSQLRQALAAGALDDSFANVSGRASASKRRLGASGWSARGA